MSSFAKSLCKCYDFRGIRNRDYEQGVCSLTLWHKMAENRRCFLSGDCVLFFGMKLYVLSAIYWNFILRIRLVKVRSLIHFKGIQKDTSFQNHIYYMKSKKELFFFFSKMRHFAWCETNRYWKFGTVKHSFPPLLLFHIWRKANLVMWAFSRQRNFSLNWDFQKANLFQQCILDLQFSFH